MARKKRSKLKVGIITVVLGLAAFGGYKAYQAVSPNFKPVAKAAKKVGDAVKEAGREVSK